MIGALRNKLRLDNDVAVSLRVKLDEKDAEIDEDAWSVVVPYLDQVNVNVAPSGVCLFRYQSGYILKYALKWEMRREKGKSTSGRLPSILRRISLVVMQLQGEVGHRVLNGIMSTVRTSFARLMDKINAI